MAIGLGLRLYVSGLGIRVVLVAYPLRLLAISLEILHVRGFEVGEPLNPCRERPSLLTTVRTTSGELWTDHDGALLLSDGEGGGRVTNHRGSRTEERERDNEGEKGQGDGAAERSLQRLRGPRSGALNEHDMRWR